MKYLTIILIIFSAVYNVIMSSRLEDIKSDMEYVLVKTSDGEYIEYNKLQSLIKKYNLTIEDK